MLILTFLYFSPNYLFFTLPYFLLLNYDTGRATGGGGTFVSFLGGFSFMKPCTSETDVMKEGGWNGIFRAVYCMYFLYMQVDIIIISSLSLSLFFPILFS